MIIIYPNNDNTNNDNDNNDNNNNNNSMMIYPRHAASAAWTAGD